MKILIVFAQASEAEASLKLLQAKPVEGKYFSVWSEGLIPCLYQFHHGWIAISSVGLHAAQMCVAQYGQGCDEVWNLGLAGGLSTQSIGELLSIQHVGKYIPSTLDIRSQECLDFTLPCLHLAPISHQFSGKSHTLSPDLHRQDSKAVSHEHCPCYPDDKSQVTERRFSPKICEKWGLEGNQAKLISSDFPIHDVEHRTYLAQKWDLVDMEGYGIAFACSYLGKKCRMWKIVSDFASPGGRELIRKHKPSLSARLAQVLEEAL
jgi:nucleoside phosphorylase